MKIKRIVSITLVCFLLVFNSHAQVAVSAALDSTNMMIGDHMKLHLTIQYPPGISINKVDYSELENDENVELLKNGNFDTLNQGGLVILQKDLLFSIYDSGTFYVPPIKVDYGFRDNNQSKSTYKIQVDVMTPQQDSVYLTAIKPIIKEPRNWRDFLPVALVVLAVILLSGLVLYFVNRKGKEVAPPPPIRKVPAHEIANDKLDGLKKKQLWQNGEVKAYQSELTYIVREYLENRYDAQALESTTSEILNQLKSLDFDDNMKSQLREMLELADRVKFAKAEPPVEAHERLMNYAESFVEKTKPELTEEGYKEGLVELPPE